VQLIEEAGNVYLLRAETLAGIGDDGGVEAETLAVWMPADAPGTPRWSW